MWNIYEEIGTFEERELVKNHLLSLNDSITGDKYILPIRYNGVWWRLYSEYKQYSLRLAELVTLN